MDVYYVHDIQNLKHNENGDLINIPFKVYIV